MAVTTLVGFWKTTITFLALITDRRLTAGATKSFTEHENHMMKEATLAATGLFAREKALTANKFFLLAKVPAYKPARAARRPHGKTWQ